MAESKYLFLKKLAQDKEESAAERMRVAQSRLSEAETRLEQLRTFHAEYQQRLVASGMKGMSVLQWRDFQAFIARLAEALKTQENEVDRARQNHALEKHAWQEERKRVKAFEKLMEREAEEALKRENRAQQKTTDEFAARKFWDTQHKPE